MTEHTILFARATVEVRGVPDGQSDDEWVDEMDDDLRMGLQAVADRLAEKYGARGARFTVEG